MTARKFSNSFLFGFANEILLKNLNEAFGTVNGC